MSSKVQQQQQHAQLYPLFSTLETTITRRGWDWRGLVVLLAFRRISTTTTTCSNLFTISDTYLQSSRRPRKNTLVPFHSFVHFFHVDNDMLKIYQQQQQRQRQQQEQQQQQHARTYLLFLTLTCNLQEDLAKTQSLSIANPPPCFFNSFSFHSH